MTSWRLLNSPFFPSSSSTSSLNPAVCAPQLSGENIPTALSYRKNTLDHNSEILTTCQTSIARCNLFPQEEFLKQMHELCSINKITTQEIKELKISGSRWQRTKLCFHNCLKFACAIFNFISYMWEICAKM